MQNLNGIWMLIEYCCASISITITYHHICWFAWHFACKHELMTLWCDMRKRCHRTVSYEAFMRLSPKFVSYTVCRQLFSLHANHQCRRVNAYSSCRCIGYVWIVCALLPGTNEDGERFDWASQIHVNDTNSLLLRCVCLDRIKWAYQLQKYGAKRKTTQSVLCVLIFLAHFFVYHNNDNNNKNHQLEMELSLTFCHVWSRWRYKAFFLTAIGFQGSVRYLIVCATNKRFHTLLKKKENSILIEVINHFTYHWSAFLSAIFAFVLVGFDIEPILYPKNIFSFTLTWYKLHYCSPLFTSMLFAFPNENPRKWEWNGSFLCNTKIYKISPNLDFHHTNCTKSTRNFCKKNTFHPFLVTQCRS